MPDYGAKVANHAITTIDRKLRRTYKKAQQELEQKLSDFTKRFEAKDSMKRQQLSEGKISAQDYQNWLAGQVFMKGQWESKIKEVTQVLFHHNEEAASIVHQHKLNVFAENYNYEAFKAETKLGQVDTGMGLSFDVYNAQAVERLVRHNPQVLPRWRVHEEKDYDWNYKKANNIVKQGIIQGESIDQIAKRLCRDLTTQNENKMRMFARTAITGAQNAGRQQQMNDAADMGVEVNKQWLATLDSRTRDAHRHLDGQEVRHNEPFVSDFGEIEYPGDPSADPANVYNCRCTMVSIYPKYEDRSKSSWRESEEVDGQSYAEWKEHKTEQNKDYGSATGVIGKTMRYNEADAEVNERISVLDKEYAKLNGESIMKFGTPEYDEMQERMNQIQEEIEELRRKSIDIKADRDRLLSQSGEKDIKKLFGEIKGAHNAAVDAKSVNVITGDKMTQLNCGSCVLAFDARRRGVDCQAILSLSTNNGQVETWWQGIKIKSAASYWGTDAREEIRSTAEKWGEGARGIVQVDWSHSNGHYFAFEVVQGKCVFFDPQVGGMNVDELFKGALPGSTRYARTDDKPLTNAALFALRGKSK